MFLIVMAVGLLVICTEVLPLAAMILIVQYFPGMKKEDVGGQGGDTLEEVMAEDQAEEDPVEDGPAEDGPAEDGPAEDGPAEDLAEEDPAEDGPALEGPADDVEVVEVDPVNPAIGWVKERLRKGALLCVEVCNVAEADGLEEFNPDDEG